MSALDTATWRKATFSNPNGDCVEIARPAIPDATTWRKATFSNPNGTCVEIARPDAPVVGIRDSKAPHTGRLVITPAAFTALMDLATSR